MRSNFALPVLASTLLLAAAGCGTATANPISSGGSGGSTGTTSTDHGSTGTAGSGGGGGSSAGGACDPACGSGQVCVEGACHAIEALATQGGAVDGVCSIVADATNVYWQGGSVQRVPRSGGEVTLFAWTPQPANLVVGAADLFFRGVQGIYSVDKTSSANGSVFSDWSGSPAQMAGDGTTLYWLEPANDDGPPSVDEVPYSGMANPVGTPAVFSADWAGYGGIAVDATSVYYWGAAEDTLLKRDKTTLASTVVVNTSDLSFTFDFGGAASGITVDGDTLYYSSVPAPGSGGVVARVSTEGGDSTVVVDGSLGATGVFAVDATDVYFMNPDGVMKVAKTGGTAVMVSPFDPPTQFTSCIAADDTYVYWIDGATLMRYTK